jgi:REP-associated tyrosine transposase
MRQKRPRLNPALYVGLQRYSLTFCTSERRSVFTTLDVVNLVLDQILPTAPLFDVAIIVHCFMPDHAHLLVAGISERAELLPFVHRAKQVSGYAFKQRWKTPLWQPSFWDRVLRDEDATLSVARYILENPVRAGLVKSPRDYPFLGSEGYTIDQILEAACWQP